LPVGRKLFFGTNVHVEATQFSGEGEVRGMSSNYFPRVVAKGKVEGKTPIG